MRRSLPTRALWWLLGAAGVAALALAGSAALSELSARAAQTPTARVELGTLDQSLHLLGELRTTQSAMLLAPPGSGSLRILTLLPTGAPVKAGDLVVSFDTADQEYQLALAQSQLREAQYEIAKLEADRAVQAAKDEVDVLAARYRVREAELGTRGNDLIGRVEARKNELTLEEAHRQLEELERNIGERAATSRAALDVAEERRHKAQIGIDEAERNIAQMKIYAPFDGVVRVHDNRDASGGFFYTGMTLPEYAEGDMANPGRPIADVLDIASLEVLAKAPESAGAILAAGQQAEVALRGRAETRFRARVKSVGAVASRGGSWWDATPAPMFDVMLELDARHAELRPGQTVELTVDAQPIDEALHVPRQAVFEQRGSTVVFARRGGAFEPRPVKVVLHTETRSVIEGVDAGVEVALVNPEDATSPTSGAAGSTPLLGAQ